MLVIFSQLRVVEKGFPVNSMEKAPARIFHGILSMSLVFLIMTEIIFLLTFNKYDSNFDDLFY